MKFLRIASLFAFLAFTLHLNASASAAVVRPVTGQLAGKTHVPASVANGTAKLLGHAPAEQRYELAVAIPVRDEAGLDALRAAQQDKTSARYRKWLTVGEFADRFGASPADYAKVVSYLKAQGFTVTMQHANRLAVSFTGSTEQVERAFHVTMNVYQHPTEDRTFYAPDREPTVSTGTRGLSVRLLLIAGLDNSTLPVSKRKKFPGSPGNARTEVISNAAPPVTCDSEGFLANVGDGPCGTYTPGDIRAAYYGGTALTGTGQQIGILADSGTSFYPADLTGFAGLENMTAPAVTFKLGAACTASCNDGEQMLDILWSSGMAPGAQINFFASGNDLTLINAMASDTSSSVYTSSWGWYSGNYTAEDTDFKEMQTQGQTFLNATGDDGAYNGTTWSFPSGDPYITEVGGTSLTTNGFGGSWASELAWPYSSGGVAPATDKIGGTNYGVTYAIPSWQTGAVNSSNGISSTYRSDPDISGEADFDMLGCQGSKKNGNSCTDDYGGTSYAAPVWAGFFALANQASAAAGNGTLGFINPELYAAGESSLFSANYHDVTACLPSSAGETTGPDCNSPDEGTKTQGYNPVAGFDDVTGWGSPSGIGLIDALSIPTLVISAAPYTTVSSITFTANFPEADGTVTFTAKAGSAAATTIGTCTVASGTCSKTVPGSALGVGTYTIQAVYQEISTSTKKYSATQNITVTYGLTFTSVSHNFGQVAVGTAASAYGINVKNTGTVAYPFTLVFTPANGFTSANNCGSSVAAGAACELVFYFTPTTNSAVSATWSLTAASSFSYSPSNGGTLTGSARAAGLVTDDERAQLRHGGREHDFAGVRDGVVELDGLGSGADAGFGVWRVCFADELQGDAGGGSKLQPGVHVQSGGGDDGAVCVVQRGGDERGPAGADHGERGDDDGDCIVRKVMKQRGRRRGRM